MDLDGKVAVITGASRGIGKAAALAFAARGSVVVLAARTDAPRANKPGTVHETADAISAAGGTAIALRCDVGKQEDLDHLVAETLGKFLRCDVLVNNAAVINELAYAGLATLTRAQLERFLAVNLIAPFVLASRFSPGMKERGRGIIFNLTSGAAQPVDLSQPVDTFEVGIPYATTKAALDRLSNAIARDLQPFGIPCITIDPGFTDTHGEATHEALAARGKDASVRGHPALWPANVMVALAEEEDAMPWSGRIVDVEAFVAERGLG